MAIPVYRHNLDHDDWEVASVYDSDDCDSMGRSEYADSSHSSDALDDPALHLVQGPPHDDTRFRFGYPMPQPSSSPLPQHQNYPPPYPRPRRDVCHAPAPAPAPGKGSSVAPPPTLIVPPPGVIFPPKKDWALPPQDPYWPSTTSPMAHPSDMLVPVDVGPMDPPPLPLLLAPSSPPRVPSPLMRRPSPTTPTAIAHAHGPPSHATSVTVTGPGSGTWQNVTTHASCPIKVLPPPYHELTHIIPPRLTEGGCQAHTGVATSAPRRGGHDVLASSYAPGTGHALMPRGAQSGEENIHVTVVDGRHGGGGGGGTGANHVNNYPDRLDLHPPPVPRKYEQERAREHGTFRTARPYVRERRPSIWQRFVRRFSPSRVSVGQT